VKIAGVYLAAGRGRRMNGAKLSAELLPGRPLGGFAWKVLLSVGFDALYAVVRPGEAPEWLAEAPPVRADGPDRPPETVVCEDAEQGMAHSLRCGVGRAAAAGHDAVVVALADQPFVTAAMVRALLDGWRSNPQWDYVASGCGDVMTPPVLLAKSTFPQIARLEGDAGAKRLLARSGFVGRVLPVAEPERLMDVDTPALLEKARQHARQYYVI